MAADMEASMLIMFNMHVHVCVHVHMHACVHRTPPAPHPYPTPIHPSATPQGGTPRNQLKFDNT